MKVPGRDGSYCDVLPLLGHAFRGPELPNLFEIEES
jgi:hypothetical protein